MAEDLKLYAYFVEKLARISPIKRAWFTTFNLDISFFEKYLLSALLNKEHEDIKTPQDYEALSAELANDASELDGQKTEVRVFHDFRTLKTEGKPKQTAVHLHPIDLKQINADNAPKFTEGVFHPKVILLETYSGQYWLMVSSANLTLGGWARNRECFFFEQITTTTNAREVGRFFSAITAHNSDFDDNVLLRKLNSGRFASDESTWAFVSSFGKRSLMDALITKNNPQPLRVWSPYFADDLSQLIAEYRTSYFSSVEIIPAKNENLKIKITEEAFAQCQTEHEVQFLQDKLPQAAQEAFVHAKVWLTPQKIAIGSWNMTRAGMNCAKSGNNNIEAGIIRTLSDSEYSVILSSYATKELLNASFSTHEELNEEKEDILDPYSISIELMLNWDDGTLQLVQPVYSDLLSAVGESATIALPGMARQNITILEHPIHIKQHSRLFLNDRFFELSDAQNNILYKGYLREIGLASRPVNSFENIDDYLKGWVSKAPEDKTELHRLAYASEGDDELRQQTKAILQGNDQNSWFTSFHAFECIASRIKSTTNESELKRIGRVLPGSLNELKLHLEKLLELYTADKNNFKKSPIYLWFLIEKANEVFAFFNSKMPSENERIPAISNLQFQDVVNMDRLIGSEKQGIEKWKQYILEKIKIEA